MKEIKLGKSGKVALVSDEDYEKVNLYKWHHRIYRGKIYVERTVQYKLKRQKIRLHNFIVNPPEGFMVDHADNDGLNNQRNNLRICTASQNQANAQLRKDNSTGYKGVGFHKPSGKFYAQIQINGKRKHLGLFADVIEAARVYDEIATKLFGEFAVLNLSKK